MIALTVWLNGSFSDVFVSLVPSGLVYFILHLRIPRYCNEGLALPCVRTVCPRISLQLAPPPLFFFSLLKPFLLRILSQMCIRKKKQRYHYYSWLSFTNYPWNSQDKISTEQIVIPTPVKSKNAIFFFKKNATVRLTICCSFLRSRSTWKIRTDSRVVKLWSRPSSLARLAVFVCKELLQIQ